MSTSISAPIVWSEIDQRFDIDGSGNIRMAYNVDAVKSSIINILGTRQGSRVMRISFAETYMDFLFEPIDSHLASYLSDRVKETIEFWDDRVTVTSANFKSDPDNNKISLDVYYLIRGYSDIFRLSHDF